MTARASTDGYLKTIARTAGSVAAGDDIGATLDGIARSATDLAIGDAGAVFVRAPSGQLELRGKWRLNRAYQHLLLDAPPKADDPADPVSLAATQGFPHVVESLEPSSMNGAPRRRGPYRSLIALPLASDAQLLGAMVVYGGEERRWPEDTLRVLSPLAGHAAMAIRIANLMAQKDRQLEGLGWVVRGLREQAHEHANRIHSITGMLALGDLDDARRFVEELLSGYRTSRASVAAGIGHKTIQSLLLAEVKIASQRGIELKVDRRSKLTCLPPSLGEIEAVVLVGHLLEHALDAVSGEPKPRRRVTFSARTRQKGIVLSTRDWGSGSVSHLRFALEDAVLAVGARVEWLAAPVGTITRITAD